MVDLTYRSLAFQGWLWKEADIRTLWKREIAPHNCEKSRFFRELEAQIDAICRPIV